jgi:fibronectin-binding autotransporter adhesin
LNQSFRATFLSIGILAVVLAGKVNAQFWANPTSADWDNTANWAPGAWPAGPPAPFPNGVGAVATFQNIPAPPVTGPITITSAGTPSFTVGTIEFEGVGSSGVWGYTLDSSYSIVMDNAGSGAAINVNPAGWDADHVINSDVILNDSLTISVATPNTLTINGIISDATSLMHPLTVAAGPGSVILTGANTFAGPFIVQSGILELQDPGHSGTTTGAASGGNVVAAGATLYLNGTAGDVSITENDLNLAGIASSASTVSSANGNNTINVNLLNATVNAVISTQGTSGSLTINASTIQINPTGSTLQFATASSTDLFINAQLMGPGNLNKTGGGRAVLMQGSPGWSGNLSIVAGIVEIQDPMALGAPTTNVINNGGSLYINNATSAVWSITENAFKIVGSGTIGEGAIYNEAGTNVLHVAGIFSVPADSTITAENGSSLDVVTPTIQLGGGPSTTLTLQTLGPSSASSQLTIDGSITNPGTITGNVTKIGNGTATLNMANSYTGLTTVQQGVLEIRNNLALGSPAGDTTVMAGATLALDNNITTPENLIYIDGPGAPGSHGAIDNYSGINTIAGSAVKLNGPSTIGATAGDLHVNTQVIMAAGPLVVDAAGGTHVEFAGTITDYGAGYAVTKTGAGQAIFSSPTGNSYAGNTVVNDGTLTLATPAGSNSAITNGNVSINGPTATLSLAASDQIANSVTMTLNGGTFATQGNSETLSTLTLNANSILDLGAGASIIHFDDSSAIPWTGTLSIWNWSGNAISGLGTDQVYFDSIPSFAGLTAAQLLQIYFYSDSGTTLLGNAVWATNPDEITVSAVPEPSTFAVGLLLLGMVGYKERRWLLRCRSARAVLSS